MKRNIPIGTPRKPVNGASRRLAISMLLLTLWALWLPDRSVAEGSWMNLANTAPGGVETMLLLSDGTVMAQNGGGTGWYRLTPDSTGSYINGNWTTLASMHYTRLYYSSDVLEDGRVFVAGAEYGTGTTNAEIYDPVANSWSIVLIPGGIINTNNTIGGQGQNTQGFIDSGSVMLNDGKVLIFPVGPANYGETAIYDPVGNGWTSAYLQNANTEDEACTVKLPDDSILVVDSGGTSSERYIPALNSWVNDTNVPVVLYDPYGTEQGPAFLLPNGNAFFIGSLPNTAIYTPSGNTNPGTWIAGPTIPSNLGAPDAPAAMMKNGKILCALSPTPTSANHFPTPSYFYEYDYSVGAIGAFTQIHAPGGGYTRNQVTFNDRMLVLPDGSVLFTDGGSQLFVYQPDGAPLTAGKPAIISITQNASGSYHLIGTTLNGISAGASYGDDAQMDSNYPLVRLYDGSGHLYYARTHDWSSTGVMTGSKVVTTEFTLPSAIYQGGGQSYSLVVVGNGIASDPVTFYSPVWVQYGLSDAGNGTYARPYNTLARGTNGVQTGGTILFKYPGSTPEKPRLAKPMIIGAVGGPATIGQ